MIKQRADTGFTFQNPLRRCFTLYSVWWCTLESKSKNRVFDQIFVIFICFFYNNVYWFLVILFVNSSLTNSTPLTKPDLILLHLWVFFLDFYLAVLILYNFCHLLFKLCFFFPSVNYVLSLFNSFIILCYLFTTCMLSAFMSYLI